MLDTLDTLVGKVQQRVGLTPDYFLVRDWILAAYRDVMNRIPWTWRRRRSQFITYSSFLGDGGVAGTVSITRGQNVAHFTGATVNSQYVGQQLRAGGNNRTIRTITGIAPTAVGDSATVYLDDIWGYDNITAVQFEIYQAYYPVPNDFDSFITIVDTIRNFQLDWWSHTTDELDRVDPMRSYGGNIAYWLVLKDYAAQPSGTVSSAIQALGSGSVPIFGGTYTGAQDATFTVVMQSATTFEWKRDSNAPVTGVSITAAGTSQPIALQDGVYVAFPASGTYVTGDVFVARCSAVYGPNVPRYEFWPHIKTNENRDYLYLAKLPDLDDPGATLPRYMRGDVLVEMALAAAARWADKDNQYFNLKLAMMHDARAESMLVDLEREDQARETTDLVYDNWTQLPVFDSGYLAGHDIGYELNVLDEA